MKKMPKTRSPFLNTRTIVGAAFCAVAVAIALLAFGFYPRALQAQGQKEAPGKLTAEEAKVIADGIKPMLNDSAEGLTSVRHADGSVSTDLQGRFQNVTVAIRDANGVVTQGCVNNTDAAAGFFGIDRQLLDLPAKPDAAKPGPVTLSDR